MSSSRVQRRSARLSVLCPRSQAAPKPESLHARRPKSRGATTATSSGDRTGAQGCGSPPYPLRQPRLPSAGSPGLSPPRRGAGRAPQPWSHASALVPRRPHSPPQLLATSLGRQGLGKAVEVCSTKARRHNKGVWGQRESSRKRPRQVPE